MKRKKSRRSWSFSDTCAVRRNRAEQQYVSPTLQTARWLDRLAGRFFTASGRVLLVAYVLLDFFALLLTRSPAFLLFLLLTGLFLLDGLFKLFFPRRIRIERLPPPRAVCGVPFEIRTEIRNDSFLPAWDFALNSNLHSALKPLDKPAVLYCLPPHSGQVIRQKYLLTRRGIYDLPPANAEGVFPFRLMKAVQRGQLRQELICHPAYTQFRSLTLPSGARLQGQESMNSTPSAGDSLDFLGCREYHAGDDPRKIHWSASARRNRLVVKVFQEEKQSSAAIVLDNYCPSPARDLKTVLKKMFTFKPFSLQPSDLPFEAAVSLTASIAHSLAAQNFTVEVFASGSEIHHFRTGRRAMTFESFLDLLSSLECSRAENRFNRLAAADLNRIAASGAVFLILLHLDSESEKLCRELRKRGTSLRVFLLDPPDEVPAWAETLSSAEILENRRSEL